MTTTIRYAPAASINDPRPLKFSPDGRAGQSFDSHGQPQNDETDERIQQKVVKPRSDDGCVFWRIQFLQKARHAKDQPGSCGGIDRSRFDYPGIAGKDRAELSPVECQA